MTSVLTLGRGRGVWGAALQGESYDTCSTRAPCLVQTEPVVGQIRGSRGR